jgi:hypothetical protein
MKLLDIIFESVVDMEEGRKSMSKDEFVRRSKEVHGDKYSYDNVVMNGLNKTVNITCALHGDFPQIPNNHLQGKEGCKKCNKKNRTSNTDDFIKKAQEIHFLHDKDGNKIPKYTYDNVVYIQSETIVNITCSIHGDFPQTPNNHLQGNGCGKCAREERKSNTEEFINDAQSMKVHQNDDGTPKYTYDNVVYIASNKKVMITCPLHGDFPQTPNNHLQGREGCKKCYSKLMTSNTEEFINDAQSMKVHQNDDGTPKYTYDNVVYIGSFIKVNITCPIHSPIQGDFPQTPNNHLQGMGCPWCNKSKGEKRISQILFEKNIKSIPLKKYDDCISYRSRNELSKRCYKLEFDFYLPENNTLVEYDGEYHFIQRKNVSLEQYRYNVLNDREKNEYTKAKNIKFIRIGYLDKENIEEELMKGLDSNEQLYLSTKYPIDKGWRDTTIKV